MRILVAVDHSLFREGLTALLQWQQEAKTIVRFKRPDTL